MVGFYPLCAFGENRVAASIDTPLHAFLPFAHVDHLHPDWAIALAASANGKARLEEFNQKYGRKIVWVPWQRPGFELALMLRKAVEDNPGCDGIILGGHGLFTWGDDAARLLSEQHQDHRSDGGVRPGARQARRPRRCSAAPSPRPPPIAKPIVGGAAAVPARRRVVEPPRHRPLRQQRRCAGVRQLAVGARISARWARAVPITSCARASRRCSCPGSPKTGLAALKQRIARAARHLPRGLRHVLPGARRAGLAGAARLESVGRRDSRARAVRLRQGQARSADHHRVLRQRDSRDGGRQRARGRATPTPGPAPQARRAEQAGEFKSFHNYVALPRSRGVPHRVLGARRGQAAADAARARIQPAASSSWSAAAAASAARSRCSSPSAAPTSSSPTSTRRAPRRSPRKPAALSSPEMVLGVGARSHARATASPRRSAPRSCGSAASTS